MLAKRRMEGFGLLEVLVAMVMIVSIGVTLVLWVEGGMRSVVRMREVSEQVQIKQVVGEWSRTLNPSVAPRGKVEIKGFRIEWSSEVVFASRPQIGFPAGIGSHDVGLYNVKIDVFRPGSEGPLLSQEVQLLGYVRARESTAPWALGP